MQTIDNKLLSKVIVGIMEFKMSQEENKLQEVYNQLQKCLKTTAELDKDLCDSLILNDLNLQICKAISLIIKQTNMLIVQADTLQSFKQKVLNLILELEGEQFYYQVISKLAVSNKPFEKVILQEVNKLGVPKFNNFVKRVREIKSLYQFPTVEDLLGFSNNSILKDEFKLPADESVQSRFVRLVLNTVAEYCNEEALAKVVAVYKSLAKLGVGYTNKFLLNEVWAICGNEVVKKLYFKVKKADLLGCWTLDDPLC